MPDYITVAWDPVPEAEVGYKVYFGNTPASAARSSDITDLYPGSRMLDPEAPSVTYKPNLDLRTGPGHRVCFLVKAYTPAGESDFSEAACATL
jgi:hypothetical protein